MLYATHARVDLAAIRHNLEGARRLADGRQVLAAVKADAYGHGAVAVARMIEGTACADWLGVATVPEAIELREAGVGLPILKLSHCFEEELEAAVRHRVCLTVVDERTIHQAQAAAEAQGVVAQVQLKVDTGMRRIGCDPGEAPRLAELVDAAPNLTLRGIFTHLPVSDMADEMDFTRDELRRFRACVDDVEAARGPVELVHATPSGGLLQHDLDQMTMVRPGIMVYGCYPDASTRHSVELEPALQLLSRVSFVKQVRAGETVGYGRTWQAPQDSWVATVPIGYADGFSRLNSNRGVALVHGQRRPVAGRVCMDQTMLDLGPHGADVRPGDEVVLIGTQGHETLTADDMATVMGTISYEVTCLLTARVRRVHVDAEFPDAPWVTPTACS